MIKHFLNLEWKSFFRSSSFGKDVGIKILMGFFAFILILEALAFGIVSFSMIKEKFPDKDPFLVVNSFLIFALIGDLVFRYMMQKLPIINLKSYLTLPIKKSKLVNYVLGKSAFSFFNILPLFFYMPFSIMLLTKGYNTAGVLSWLAFIFFTTLCLNYVNFLINKNNIALAIIIAVLSFLLLSIKFNWFDVQSIFGEVFYSVYELKYLAIIPFLLLIVLYIINYKSLKDNVFLDNALQEKTKEVKSSNLSFVDKLGDVAPFIKNDIRLILRNKRTKNVFLMSFIFTLYPMLFMNMEPYNKSITMLIFAFAFVTGGFSMNYGQFVPAWDSEHYKMLMSQNIPYRKFLESKWYLMVIMTAILTVVSVFYLYFGTKYYIAILALGFFNLGFTPLLMLYMGAYNKKRIDLTKSGFSNYQGISAFHFVVILPILIIPNVVFALVNYFLGFYPACISLALIGVISFALKNQLMNVIEKKYQQKKYVMIHGFSQKS